MFVWWKENGRIDDEINWNEETFWNSWLIEIFVYNKWFE